ncbi:MAG: DUF2769 domain-containing protein [Alphaproteobacteria bacterium]|nr:DUF2769 domain-containing protein [Alphaproteobacteria bacterium]
MLVAKTKENLQGCRCRDCPSYTTGCKVKNYPGNFIKMMTDLDNVEHFEGMFCAFEKSHCIDEDRGCLCEECPVHAKYNLLREDYCLKTGGLVSRSCTLGFDRDKKN